jgi:hypothetical protein
MPFPWPKDYIQEAIFNGCASVSPHGVEGLHSAFEDFPVRHSEQHLRIPLDYDLAAFAYLAYSQ